MEGTRLCILCCAFVWCSWAQDAATQVVGLEDTKRANKYVTLDGEQCTLLSHVQSSVLELYSNDQKCNKNVHHLQKMMHNVEAKVAGMENQVQKALLYSRAQNAQPVAQVPPPPAQSHSKGMSEKRMMHMTKRNNKVLNQMVKNTERKTSNMVRDIDRRTSYNYKLLERKLQNMRQHFQHNSQSARNDQKDIRNVRMENRKSQELIQRQAGTINDLKDRLDWVERAMNKMIHNGYLYQHDDPSATVEVPKMLEDICPIGFLRNAMSCYKFENASLNWEEAERYCRTYGPGAHLVSVETKVENDFILGIRKYNEAKWSSPFVWTGGHDSEREGQWKWVGTGKFMAFNYWLPKEPNGAKAQNCMYYTGEGERRWDDYNCLTTRMNFICEIQMSANKLTENGKKKTIKMKPLGKKKAKRVKHLKEIMGARFGSDKEELIKVQQATKASENDIEKVESYTIRAPVN